MILAAEGISALKPLLLINDYDCLPPETKISLYIYFQIPP